METKFSPIKYLIVGGGVAGITAAEEIRRRDPVGTLAIVGDEPYRFYSRLMLSKPGFFLGEIPFDHIWLKPENWYAENKINYLKGRKAVKLDPAVPPAGGVVTLDDGQKLNYEKLLLATGTEARRWGIPGAEKKGVCYLRDLDEGKGVIEGIKTAKRGATIGGGFVSFEMAELLKKAGLETTTIIREPSYWEPLLDRASGEIIERAIVAGGIKLIKNAEVAEVLGGERVEALKLTDGREIPCDLVVCGIGTTADLEWLKAAGVKIGRGILVNEFMETNLPGVWAAGDATEFNDLILGTTVQLGNWANAREQGRVAGLNLAASFDELKINREPMRYVSFYTTQGLGLTIAFVGDVRPLPERQIIIRGAPGENAYGRIFVVAGEIVGATLINRSADLLPLAKLIERDWLVAGHESELADPHFDLKNLATPAPQPITTV